MRDFLMLGIAALLLNDTTAARTRMNPSDKQWAHVEGSRYCQLMNIIGKAVRIAATAIMVSCVGYMFAQDTVKDKNQRPNIVWIVCEDIGAYIGACGYKGVKTPNIDNLAKESCILVRTQLLVCARQADLLLLQECTRLRLEPCTCVHQTKTIRRTHRCQVVRNALSKQNYTL